MQKQFKICHEVLRRLHKAGVLSDIVIVGSWCLYYYKYYFNDSHYSSAIRTRDIDLLVPNPNTIKAHVDVAEILKDLGFVLDFHPNGLMRIIHPELIIEFLVPDKGRGSDKPQQIKQLHVNAQALRYMNLLKDHTITVNAGDLNVALPHPAAFALQKLIISGRRQKKEKANKDLANASMILQYLIASNKINDLKAIYSTLPNKWKSDIGKAIEQLDDKNLANSLNNDILKD